MEDYNSNTVVFQGWLNISNTSSLLAYLEEWMSSKPTIMVAGRQLEVVAGEEETVTDSSEEDDNMLYFVLGAAIAFIVLVAIVAIVLCCVGIYKRRQKK